MNLCNEEFTIKCLYSKHWDHWKNKNFYIDHAVVAGGVAISFISITKVCRVTQMETEQLEQSNILDHAKSRREGLPPNQFSGLL